ncbi:MAG: SDR family oxidoreductase [Gaiellaceae bacterium]|jgi:nucleoside-diphosphate-sugar epimerase
MRVLFIGGTGNISIAATRLLAKCGADLTLFNRGQQELALPAGVRQIKADIRDRPAAAAALAGEEFDVVVDWVAFVPAHVETDLALFAGKISHYVFISSATVYERPSPFFPTVEQAPLGNAHWQYARDKIACEERLRREYELTGFPATIVRPSYTYGESWIPTAIEGQDYTVIARIRRGKKIIVPGDGESLWTMTHNSDFARALVGLLGNPAAAGESFHITSDEVLSWNQITKTIAAAAGLEARIVHIPSDFIAAAEPELGPGLLGDKSHSLVFDNSKIKRFVPGWEARVPFAEGVARSIKWFEEDPARRAIDEEWSVRLDRIVAAFEAGWPAGGTACTNLKNRRKATCPD